MSIPVELLTENDYRILAYVNKFKSVSEKQITNRFNGKINAVKYRLSILSEPDFEYRIPIDNTSYIAAEFDEIDTAAGKSYKRNGYYHISPLGQTVLQDHIAKKKAARFEHILLILTLCASVVSAIAAIISAVK